MVDNVTTPLTFARAMFALAAAVIAAALVDPFVEFVSNDGLFGRTTFTDHSSLIVMPVLVIGAALSVLVGVGLVRHALFRRSTAPRWLRRCARAGVTMSPLALVPIAFPLQLGVLWAMETLEQMLVVGHPMGGTIWLGGPIAFSLLLHFAGSVITLSLLARLLRWSAETITDVVHFVIALFQTLVASAPLARAWTARHTPHLGLEPLLARLHGRAPPTPHLA